MTVFDPACLYELDFQSLTIGNLPRAEIVALFKDGRVGSHIVDRILPHTFSNIQRVHNKGAAFDMRICGPTGKWEKTESKTLTTNGLSVTPSSQKGKGRTFDQKEALGRALSTHYYVITDLTAFPNPLVWTLSQNQVVDIVQNHSGSLSSTKARKTKPPCSPTKVVV
jgi:hypothetical protein